MNNRVISFSLCLIVAVSISLGCKKSDSMAKGPDPAAVWEEITKKNPYQKWSFWPDHKGFQPGNAPHGPIHKLYVNDIALKSKKPLIADGGILVKENYDKAKTLKAVTIMYKVKGYNPAANDWFWVKYSPDGKADKSGKVQGCIQCHGSAKDNDYMLIHSL